MVKIRKRVWWIFFGTIIYTILFGFHFYTIGNLEFVWYVFNMFILIGIVSLLHRKYNFSTVTIFGISLWGLLHMFGGSTLLTTERLYVQVLYEVFRTGDVIVFSYDHFMHFYFYMVVTAMVFQVLKTYFKEDVAWTPVAILLVLIGMGIGALNEIIEFVPVLAFGDTGVGGYFNIAWDIVFNALGSLATVIYLGYKRVI